MKITVGEWKTRDGRKAIVAAINGSARSYTKCIGWVNGSVFSWCLSGKWTGESNQDLDLVAPWIDPVSWDWSTTPPWINWIAKDEDGAWWMYQCEPECRNVSWSGKGNSSHQVPLSHAPKWSGDWRKSKTMRPGFNGGAK